MAVEIVKRADFDDPINRKINGPHKVDLFVHIPDAIVIFMNDVTNPHGGLRIIAKKVFFAPGVMILIKGNFSCSVLEKTAYVKNVFYRWKV